MSTETHKRRVLPVSLLVEGRECLAVGGGKVAARKVKLILEAGGCVTVVSPELCEELAALADEERIRFRRGEFKEHDLDGAFMVFAATSVRGVNRRIMEACRERGILCCSVDGNWTQGDFVTPAVFRSDELTVAVSTAGRSCRQSRLVKENISRHAEMVRNADLLVMGTSHHELALEEREPFHLVGDRCRDVGEMLMHVWGIHEFMILNTCNRVEIVTVVAKEAAVDRVLERILGFDHLNPDGFYAARGRAAFEHLSVLCAGLLSQTPGENHIVAQVKEALARAAASGWAGGMVDEWVSSCLHVSKEIRGRTAPLLKNYEIEDLCVDYLRAVQPDPEERCVLVLGTGSVGSGLMDRLLQAFPRGRFLWTYHRNEPEPAPRWRDRIEVHNLNALRELLPLVDTVICATNGSGHVLHQGHAPFFDQGKAVHVVDLSMPRNVAPELDALTPNLRVTDLDDLKHWYRREAADMGQILELARDTVGAHAEMYEAIMHSFQGRNPGQ